MNRMVDAMQLIYLWLGSHRFHSNKVHIILKFDEPGEALNARIWWCRELNKSAIYPFTEKTYGTRMFGMLVEFHDENGDDV